MKSDTDGLDSKIQGNENIVSLPNSSLLTNLEEMDRSAVKDVALKVSITTAENRTRIAFEYIGQILFHVQRGKCVWLSKILEYNKYLYSLGIYTT